MKSLAQNLPLGRAPLRLWSRRVAGCLVLVAIAVMPKLSWGAPITIKGSDTMVVLGQRGGSGTGIAALINGTTDVCQASREMKDVEKGQVKQKSGQLPIEHIVARDGVSIYVNASNPLSEVTVAQLKDIFTGKLTNWKAIGGSDAPILKVKKDKGAPAIGPSDQTVRDGSYSLSRPLLFYTRATPSGDTKAFIEWVLSPAGQAIVTKVGYFPIR